MRTFFKSLAIAGTIILFGCTNKVGSTYLVEDQLKPYVESFNNECQMRGYDPVQLSVSIKCVKFPGSLDNQQFKFNTQQPFGPDWVGVALTNNQTGEKYVFINPSQWYMSDRTGKEIIVYHELFHAYFGLPHSDNEILKPSPTDADAAYYLKNRNAVLDKVFEQVKEYFKK